MAGPWPSGIPTPPLGIPDDPWWVPYKHTLDRKHEPALRAIMAKMTWNDRILWDGRTWGLSIARRLPSHTYIDKVMACRPEARACP